MHEFGKNASSELLILSTDQLCKDVVGTFLRMLNFLELHRVKLPKRELAPRNQGRLLLEIDEVVRKRLEAFYGPYNARLNALLKDPLMIFNTYQ
jgi:hypothetical protein